MTKIYTKSDRKHGQIFEIKISSTSIAKVLEFITLKLENKEKFYIVTPNPEITLKAMDDWLLKKAINKSDISVPDGIGLKFAYKFLFKEDLPIIKGRKLFLEIIKLADQKKLKVFFVDGLEGGGEKAKIELEKTYKKIEIRVQTAPIYGNNGQPDSVEDRNMHKSLISKIKMFEPDLIFVGLGAPKQEKWIFRNFFRLNSTGAMAVGGTFNYVGRILPLPPKWAERLGLEWVFRLISEPKRIIRIFKSVAVFPLKVVGSKFKK